MSKSDRADWAAQVPWDGIQGKPELIAALGSLSSSQMKTLLALIGGLPVDSDFSKVAFTGRYADLSGLPEFGSAAFASTTSFLQPNAPISVTTIDASGLATFDFVASALPATVGVPQIRLGAEDSMGAGIESIAYAATGFQFFARRVGGTRETPAATSAGVICDLLAYGYDTDFTLTPSARYQMTANSLWSGTNRETAHVWTGTPNGSIVAASWMTLIGGNLTVNAGSLATAAPAIGAAGAWKLGKYTAGAAVQAGKVRVNIDGVDYDLLTA
jgi:hypothetical protein